MHRFARGDEPIDFKKHVGSPWKDFIGTDDHAKLADALYERQDGYCAYCEIHLEDQSAGHIEHLERRRDTPQRTFDWTNLFYSCNKSDSCGKHKDDDKKRIRFNPAAIIDPSEENPLDFFVYTANGRIVAKEGTGQRRAEETIRVFNLNCSRLNSIRKNAAMAVSCFLEYVAAEADRAAFMQSVRKQRLHCLSVYESLLEAGGG